MTKKDIHVKPVLVTTSIKQATCIKQACVQFSEKANMLQHTCIKQAPVLSKHFWLSLRCLLNTVWTVIYNAKKKKKRKRFLEILVQCLYYILLITAFLQVKDA